MKKKPKTKKKTQTNDNKPPKTPDLETHNKTE